jgi:hypothetical protein
MPINCGTRVVVVVAGSLVGAAVVGGVVVAGALVGAAVVEGAAVVVGWSAPGVPPVVVGCATPEWWSAAMAATGTAHPSSAATTKAANSRRGGRPCSRDRFLESSDNQHLIGPNHPEHAPNAQSAHAQGPS